MTTGQPGEGRFHADGRVVAQLGKADGHVGGARHPGLETLHRLLRRRAGQVQTTQGEERGDIAAQHPYLKNPSETLAIELAATVEDLAETIHTHPTVSESVMEAALGLDGRPLHVHR